MLSEKTITQGLGAYREWFLQNFLRVFC
ncbi:uncharacterized protein METZ01_LOCUS38951 [marine metagenome]|uniref:Uncharacterized protein n=1 Tax=marine metagenome TaxID=408172 RepID=A0A381R8A3_9ZZZZ